jgi:hypothetical protein
MSKRLDLSPPPAVACHPLVSHNDQPNQSGHWRSARPSLNNLAEMRRTKGDYAKAEPLYQRALAIREKALGRKK